MKFNNQTTATQEEKTHYRTACNVKVKEARTKSPPFMNVPSVDNPDISILVFGLFSDSRMFSGVDPSLISFVINLFRLMFTHVPSRLCGRRETYVLRMRLVQPHVVHYFVMITYFVIALYAR